MFLLLKLSTLIVLISFELDLQVDGAPVEKNDRGKKLSHKAEEQTHSERHGSSSYEYYDEPEGNHDTKRENHDSGKKEEHLGEGERRSGGDREKRSGGKREKRSGGERERRSGEGSGKKEEHLGEGERRSGGERKRKSGGEREKRGVGERRDEIVEPDRNSNKLDKCTGTLKGGMAKIGSTIKDGIRGLKRGPSDPKKDNKKGPLPEQSPANNLKSAKDLKEPTTGKMNAVLGNLAARSKTLVSKVQTGAAGSRTLVSKVQTGAAGLEGTLKKNLPKTPSQKNIQKNDGVENKGDSPTEKKNADKDEKTGELKKGKNAKKKDDKRGVKAEKSSEPENAVGKKPESRKSGKTEKTKRSESEE
ncbi:ABC transporter F family member 4 isoform X3 [Nilaparvata lugens]|uniref:ABC transporter F family member 4 isoform X3 n=1 Tax=Nilaparvata lugens TaxID=108931 RepID=UPI000B98D652|nr:ABC transporter F family member 4 isoform X3 [Nilaparvata lugens]